MQYTDDGSINAIDKHGAIIGKVESVHASKLQHTLFIDGIDNLIISSDDNYQHGYEAIINKKIWYDDNLYLAYYVIKNALTIKEYFQFMFYKLITRLYTKSF